MRRNRESGNRPATSRDSVLAAAVGEGGTTEEIQRAKDIQVWTNSFNLSMNSRE
jgi:hypothetical protein